MRPATKDQRTCSTILCHTLVTLSLLVSLFQANSGALARELQSSDVRASGSAQALWLVEDIYFGQFNAKQLRRSGSPKPSLRFRPSSGVPRAIQVDSKGNVWGAVSGIGAKQGFVFELTTGQLGNFKGGKFNAPAVKIACDARALKFDKTGNLWIADVTNSDRPRLLEYSADQLTRGDMGDPTIAISSPEVVDIQAMDFDSLGNLWVLGMLDSGLQGLFRFASADLGASGSPSPDALLVPPESVNFAPAAIAFDQGGNLWVANNLGNVTGNLQRFSAADIAGSGQIAAFPSVEIDAAATAYWAFYSLQSIAFDQDQNLWFAGAYISRFAQDEIASSGSPIPGLVLQPNSKGKNFFNPRSLAFRPAAN